MNKKEVKLPPCEKNLMLPLTMLYRPIPVSYTHLDVYKRQHPER